MTDYYALGLAADKLWSPEELGTQSSMARVSSLGGAPGRYRTISHHADLGLVRNGVRLAVSFGALVILMLTLYALSPGGTESVLNTLAVAALTLAAVFLVRVWDELRLLWSQKRGQNPAKGENKGDLP